MIDAINNRGDVILFIKELIDEDIIINPDNDFNSYINIETDEKTYSFEEAELRNKLMNQCFTVCSHENIDIYNFMLEINLKETGLDKFIPLPSDRFFQKSIN